MTSDNQTETASLEKPQDAGEGAAGVVSRWLLEWRLADRAEKDWRKDAQEVLDIYHGDKNTRFNILHSNTQTLIPALYGNTPRPDVRRRFRDVDEHGKEASEILERGLAASIDMYDFDNEMETIVEDYRTVGRGVLWLSYNPTYGDVITEPFIDDEGNEGMREVMDEDGSPLRRVVWEDVTCEAVEWDNFRMGPAKRWKDVPWVGRILLKTRKELVEDFGDIGEMVKLDQKPSNFEENDENKKHEDAIKRGIVYEIWDKTERQVLYIAPSVKAQPLKTLDDPYGLEEFFPTPRPLYSIRKRKNMVPTPEYRIYEDQAKELDKITRRIDRLLNALKARGIYDSTIGKLNELLSTDEAGLVPSEQATAAMQAGGLDKAIWMFPIEIVARVLREMYTARDQIKQAIFEITGISDIIRGSTKATETATAQSIKAQFGSLRLEKSQKEVQRIIRDVFRMKAEIMAEKFSIDTLTLISGKQVTDETVALLRAELSRKIRVDVETDSTIASDEEKDKKNITELLAATASFLKEWIPLVQQGFVPVEVPKTLLLSAVRRFKMGREVEDALNMLDQAAAPQGLPAAPPIGQAAAGAVAGPSAAPLAAPPLSNIPVNTAIQGAV